MSMESHCRTDCVVAHASRDHGWVAGALVGDARSAVAGTATHTRQNTLAQRNTTRTRRRAAPPSPRGGHNPLAIDPLPIVASVDLPDFAYRSDPRLHPHSWLCRRRDHHRDRAPNDHSPSRTRRPRTTLARNPRRPGHSSPPRRSGTGLTTTLISQRFNALNVNRWRGADSAGWADEETVERLLSGVWRSWRSRCVSFCQGEGRGFESRRPL
jgi:hypothetical protein